MYVDDGAHAPQRHPNLRARIIPSGELLIEDNPAMMYTPATGATDSAAAAAAASADALPVAFDSAAFSASMDTGLNLEMDVEMGLLD